MAFIRQSIQLVFLSFVIVTFLVISVPYSANAQMEQLSDDALDSVYAFGYYPTFSSFSVTNGITRIELNINLATYTEIDSLKMGYYDGHGQGLGWDQDWTNVSLGTSSTPLTCEGVYIEAKFTNITSAANRQLDYIKVGTPKMNGDISADFSSFSGYITDNGSPATEYYGHRQVLGVGKTISCTDSEFYFSVGASDPSPIDKTVPHEGFWFYIDHATVN